MFSLLARIDVGECVCVLRHYPQGAGEVNTCGKLSRLHIFST